jgi:hypothetical protein
MVSTIRACSHWLTWIRPASAASLSQWRAMAAAGAFPSRRGDPDTVRHKLAVLRRHCDAVGCDYDRIEKTNIISLLIARDEAGVRAKRERLGARGPLGDFLGTVSEAVDLIGRYREAGVELLINSDQRNDRETHELMAAEVMPHFA